MVVEMSHLIIRSVHFGGEPENVYAYNNTVYSISVHTLCIWDLVEVWNVFGAYFVNNY